MQLLGWARHRADGHRADAPATRLPLAAMPNAGLPRAVDGRNIYMASPEYMASFARKFIHAGRA